MPRARVFPLWLSLGLFACLLLPPGLVTAFADTARVTASSANLRAAAGVNSRVVASLPRGTQVEVLGASGDWLKVRVREGGAEGFILRRLVETMAAAAPPPAPAAQAPAPAPPPDAPPVLIQHKAVDCVVAGEHPRFQACFKPEENLGRARVLFRAVGTDPWYYVDMSREGLCHEAILPKPRKKTPAFQYFVHSLDRTFLQTQAPETAPDHAFAPRVVNNEKECQAGRAVAMFLGKLAKPIKVGVALDPTGGALVASAAGTPMPMPLTGFSTEGVELASLQPGPGRTSGESSSNSSAQAAGGVPKVALVAGGVAAAGVAVAVAAGGGGSEGSSGSGSSGGGTSPGGGSSGGGTSTSAAGVWVGRSDQGAGLAYTFADAGVSCTFRYDATLNLSQTGSSVSGTAVIGGTSFSCNVQGIGQNEINQILAGLPRENSSAPLTGTANESGVANLVIGAIPFNGNYDRTSMNLVGSFASQPGLTSIGMTLRVSRAQ